MTLERPAEDNASPSPTELRALAKKAGKHTWPTSDQFEAEWDRRTSDLLAACSPDAILALLDRLDGVERELERVRGLHLASLDGVSGASARATSRMEVVMVNKDTHEVTLLANGTTRLLGVCRCGDVAPGSHHDACVVTQYALAPRPSLDGTEGVE